MAREPLEQRKLQKTWTSLLSPSPNPPELSKVEWSTMSAHGWQRNLQQLVDAVHTIRRRGGKVIFIRFPSTGKLLELVKQTFPRSKVWAPILEETKAPGIHFEDYAELQNFSCPEWSHLSANDSVTFSERLVKIMLAEKLLVPQLPSDT